MSRGGCFLFQKGELLFRLVLLSFSQKGFDEKNTSRFGGRARFFDHLPEFFFPGHSLVVIEEGIGQPNLGLVGLGFRQLREFDFFPFRQGLFPATGFVQGGSTQHDDAVGKIGGGVFWQSGQSLGRATVDEKSLG